MPCSPPTPFCSRIADSDASVLRSILTTESESFPRDWQFPDTAKYFQSLMVKPENCFICCYAGSAIVGHLVLVPLRAVKCELSKSDPQILALPDTAYYIETLAVRKRWRRRGVASSMLIEATGEVGKRHGQLLGMHARVSNGLNRLALHLFKGSIVVNYKIDRWPWTGNEESNFLAWTPPNRSSETT